mmetsp:Transcript_10061/g.25631  ORF Transcript_10061/g.25631 Transcript_10061/m.25631 type:complete len:142 (+) Transcript_10061:183-608(+)
MLEAGQWMATASVMQCFLDAIAGAPTELQPVLSSLCALLGCHLLVRGAARAAAELRPTMLELERRLRPDAVALVDAFDYDDRILNSTLGRKDGKVYEALYEAAQRGIQEFSDPFKGYEHLEPFLDKDFLRLRNSMPTLSKL